MGSLDDFYALFDMPYVGDTIVGFSGIDPAPKGSAIIKGRNTKVLTDDEEEDITVLNHNDLENVLGGDEEEQWHLTGDEYRQLTELLVQQGDNEENGEIKISFTEDEYNKLMMILEAVYPKEDSEEETKPVFIDEDALNDLIDARILEYMTMLEEDEAPEIHSSTDSSTD